MCVAAAVLHWSSLQVMNTCDSSWNVKCVFASSPGAYVLLTRECTGIGDPRWADVWQTVWLCQARRPPNPPPSPPLHPTPVASVFDFSIFKSACQSFLCHPLILSSHHAWLTAVPPPCWEIIMNILWILPTFPKSPSIFFKRGLCGVPQEASALHGWHEEKKKPVGMAYSPSRAHLRGDNLMDVVDSAFSIHNLYGILSSKVQMHNECLS